MRLLSFSETNGGAGELGDDDELTEEASTATAVSAGGKADANNAAEADNTAVGRKRKRGRGATDEVDFREVACFICCRKFILEAGLNFPAPYGCHPVDSRAWEHSMTSHPNDPLFEGVKPKIFYIQSVERWLVGRESNHIDFETWVVYALVVKGLVNTYLGRKWGTMTVGGSTHILSDCQFHFTQWLSYLNKNGTTAIGKIIKQFVKDVKKVNDSKWKNNKVGIVEKLAIDTKKKKKTHLINYENYRL